MGPGRDEQATANGTTGFTQDRITQDRKGCSGEVEVKLDAQKCRGDCDQDRVGTPSKCEDISIARPDEKPQRRSGGLAEHAVQDPCGSAVAQQEEESAVLPNESKSSDLESESCKSGRSTEERERFGATISAAIDSRCDDTNTFEEQSFNSVPEASECPKPMICESANSTLAIETHNPQFQPDASSYPRESGSRAADNNINESTPARTILTGSPSIAVQAADPSGDIAKISENQAGTAHGQAMEQPQVGGGAACAESHQGLGQGLEGSASGKQNGGWFIEMCIADTCPSCGAALNDLDIRRHAALLGKHVGQDRPA